ncbi:MAG: hypothetical protein FWF71_00715 [Actinomycetia bacterium]|nr:hypothetical protein [Actinomycetes bacterium]
MGYKVEAFDKWQYLMGASFNYRPLIRCRIGLDGRIDTDMLKQAVAASLATFPLAAFRFGRGFLRAHWQDDGLGAEDIVHVADLTAMGGADAEEETLRLLLEEIDPEGGPQLRLNIARRADGDTICMTASHIIADGAGFKEYLYLLCELYTKIKRGQAAEPGPFVKRGMGPLFAGFGLAGKLRLVFSKYSSHRFKGDLGQLGVDFPGGESRAFSEVRAVSAAGLAALRTLAKASGGTVNDALMALFARAFCNLSGTTGIVMPATIDLRRFIPEGMGCGISNYTTFCVCRLTVGPQDTLADTIKQVSAAMGAYKSSDDVLATYAKWKLMSMLAFFYLRWVFPIIIHPPIVTFTNPGIIDAQRLGFDGLGVKAAYIMPAIHQRPQLQVCSSTFKGCCYLSSNNYGTASDQQFVAAVLDKMHGEAEALAGQ